MSESNQRQNHDLLDLIPQSRDALITNKQMLLNVLKLSQVMVKELIIALEDFYIHQNYHHFDPHVGDTACQIRAGYVLALSKCTVNFQLINSRITQLQEFYILLSELHWKVIYLSSFKNFKQEKLSNFFIENGLLVRFFENEKFLLFSFLLTKSREGYFDNLSPLNQEKISLFFSCSISQAKNLIKFMERYLSYISVQYIIELKKEVESFIKLDKKQRKQVPCFYASQAIFNSLIKSQEKLVIIVYDKDYQFEPVVLPLCGNGKNSFIATELNCEKPAFVMYAETELNLSEPSEYVTFLKIIQQHGLLTILNAYMAAHPQYSGTKLQRYREDPFIDIDHPLVPRWRSELKAYQQLALQIGCCQANPSLLFFKHALCATPSIALKLLQYRKKHGMEIAQYPSYTFFMLTN